MPDKEVLSSFRKLYVFISHSHEDHFSPTLFDLCPEETEFILGYDVPQPYEGHRLSPGEDLMLDDLRVHAYDSTDAGVSFLVSCCGLNLFHAGDLNWWHWRDSSTLQEIEESEKNFLRCVSPIPSGKIDLAFFPVDPRQGSMYDAGVGYFIMEKKPLLLIPMHFQGRADAARRFAVTSETAYTRIVVLVGAGEKADLQFGEEDESTPSEGKNASQSQEA